MKTLQGIRRVAVIGAGPAGIAATKHLLAEKYFDVVDVFDQQSKAGGVWDYVSDNNRHESCSMPQTSPDAPLQRPIWREINGSGKRATYVSAIYDQLEANLPKDLMQHSDATFDDNLPLFPGHEEIEKYLEHYAKPVIDRIKWQTQVTKVDPLVGQQMTRWSVHTKDLSSSTDHVGTYDAVLVATGHYTVPYVPDIPNIAAFGRSCSLSHSKNYASPDDFAGKRVMVVGGGPSAVDIASQIAAKCEQPLIISTRSPPNPAFVLPHARYVAQIASFHPESGPAEVELIDGTILTDIDAIVFCTGYLYSYPALPFALPAVHEAAPSPFASWPLTTLKGDRVHHVYKHLFYSAEPSLAFMLLPWNIVPFPLAEAQGACIARLWAGRLKLPSFDEMQAWEDKNAAERGSGKTFHRLQPPGDVDYLNELHAWSAEASQVEGRPPVPYWDARMRALRIANSQVKGVYMKLGSSRKQVKTLEQLGVVYDAETGQMHIGKPQM